jgi:hypothetical protein
MNGASSVMLLYGLHGFQWHREDAICLQAAIPLMNINASVMIALSDRTSVFEHSVPTTAMFDTIVIVDRATVDRHCSTCVLKLSR